MSEYPWSLTQPYPVETHEKNDLFESKVIAWKELQYQIIVFKDQNILGVTDKLQNSLKNTFSCAN